MNKSDYNRDLYMLRGPLAKKGYDWWWHSLTAENAETGEEKPFYVEFFTCNPALAEDEPKLVFCFWWRKTRKRCVSVGKNAKKGA